MNMITFMKMAAVILAVGILSGCASGKIQMVQFADGDVFEVAVISDGASELAPWKFTDIQTGAETKGVRETDSMPARVVPAVAATATGATINGIFANEISKRNECKGDSCGGAAQQVVQVGVESNSANTSQTSSSGHCGATCGSRKTLPTSF
jgi:hypothetical protein